MGLYTKYCPYNGNEFDGIISFMTNETGFQYLNEHGIIKITASSAPLSISNLFNTSSHFGTQDMKESWLMFDFLQNKVSISSYTFRYYLRDVSKEWVLLGSDDKIRWDEIDHKTCDIVYSSENDILKNYYYETRFPLMRRYIMLKNIQGRLGGNDQLFLHRFEFFGMFYYSKDIIRMTCRAKRKTINTIILLSLVILSN